MASTCTSDCVDARCPVRATYVNLYKWPESDVEFVKSLCSNERRNRNGGGCCGPAGLMHPGVVDSISCRQLYLRSYIFSRDDEATVDRRTRSCRKERVAAVNRRNPQPTGGGGGDGGGGRGSYGGGGRKKPTGFRGGAKEMSCIGLAVIFRRLLSCTTKVAVGG